jgi:hypothetical protein
MPRQDRDPEQFTEAETVARREAALKRMLSTPHQPHKPLGRKKGRSQEIAVTLGAEVFKRSPLCEDSVRQTLTFRAFERERRTFPILHLAGVPFEIPFHKGSGTNGRR